MHLSSRKNSSYSILFVLIMVLGLFSSCGKDDHWPPPASGESANVLYDWYRLAARIQLYTNPAPQVQVNNRAFAYIGVGVWESVRPGVRGSVSLSTLLYQMPAMPQPETNRDYSWSASANAALASLFKQLIGGLTDANRASIDSLENAYNNRFRLSVSDAVISRSQAYGRLVATTIYNWSTTDNFTIASTGYTPPSFPGSWVPTPPNFAISGPFLANSRPFLASTLTATVPPPPIPYSEVVGSPFYQAAMEVYEIGKALTAQQRAIANFWADAGGIGVGVPAGGHPLNIITDILESHGVNLGRAAEVYAKTGIAFKDAHIITFRGKYQYNLIRPLTYINRLIDPTWSSFLTNPPYPEYPSGFGGIFTPLMQVMIREFGDIPVTDDTYPNGPLGIRHFNSISQMIQDGAMSRIYGGLHYRFTMDATVAQGKQLGDRIANLDLTPGYKY